MPSARTSAWATVRSLCHCRGCRELCCRGGRECADADDGRGRLRAPRAPACCPVLLPCVLAVPWMHTVSFLSPGCQRLLPAYQLPLDCRPTVLAGCQGSGKELIQPVLDNQLKAASPLVLPQQVGCCCLVCGALALLCVPFTACCVAMLAAASPPTACAAPIYPAATLEQAAVVACCLSSCLYITASPHRASLPQQWLSSLVIPLQPSLACHLFHLPPCSNG